MQATTNRKVHGPWGLADAPVNDKPPSDGCTRVILSRIFQMTYGSGSSWALLTIFHILGGIVGIPASIPGRSMSKLVIIHLLLLLIRPFGHPPG
jgi:hypothetical protein